MRGEHGRVDEEEVRNGELRGERATRYQIPTRAPERYVPTWRTLGPTSRRGRLRWKKPRGSYCDYGGQLVGGLKRREAARAVRRGADVAALSLPITLVIQTHPRNRHCRREKSCDEMGTDATDDDDNDTYAALSSRS